MGNTFFDNALKNVKIDIDEIIQQKKERRCSYYLKKLERECGNLFIPKGDFNKYCPKCNDIINGKGHINYEKYKKGRLNGKQKRE